jgi:hypothetical protein
MISLGSLPVGVTLKNAGTQLGTQPFNVLNFLNGSNTDSGGGVAAINNFLGYQMKNAGTNVGTPSGFSAFNFHGFPSVVSEGGGVFGVTAPTSNTYTLNPQVAFSSNGNPTVSSMNLQANFGIVFSEFLYICSGSFRNATGSAITITGFDVVGGGDSVSPISSMGSWVIQPGITWPWCIAGVNIGAGGSNVNFQFTSSAAITVRVDLFGMGYTLS